MEDFVRLHFSVGTQNIPAEKIGLGWPPPEYIHLVSDADKESRGLKNSFEGLDEAGFQRLEAGEQRSCLKRESYSRITDEQIAEMDHVVRGADYKYVMSP